MNVFVNADTGIVNVDGPSTKTATLLQGIRREMYQHVLDLGFLAGKIDKAVVPAGMDDIDLGLKVSKAADTLRAIKNDLNRLVKHLGG